MNGNGESSTGDDGSLNLRAIGLENVHPLWGGHSVAVTDDLTAVVRVVDAAGRERRHRLTLTQEQWQVLEGLVATSGVLHAAVPERMGVPDETRPVLRLSLASGEVVTKAKWANDRVPAFDRVLEWLAALCDAPDEPLD